jgi:nicotinic acid phosphoribosyltransferase
MGDNVRGNRATELLEHISSLFTKEEVIAMLTDLQLEVEEIPLIESANSYRDERYKYLPDFRLDVYKIIQQKINVLRAGTEVEDENLNYKTTV